MEDLSKEELRLIRDGLGLLEEWHTNHSEKRERVLALYTKTIEAIDKLPF